jgi:hypothetical protein
MTSYHLRSHLPRRYVKLILEELECRYVPSLLGLQIELPASGILPSLTLPTGTGATLLPATATTPGATTPSLSVVSVSWPSSPSGQSSNPPAITSVFANPGASQQPAPASNPSGAAASSAGVSSASSSTAFNEGGNRESGSSFTSATFAFSALGIQAAQVGSSNVLGGSLSGINFEFLGNMPELLGPSNVLQGTLSTALSTAQPVGVPYGGSVFGPLDLLTNRTTGGTAAFGLTHPAPEQQPEEPLPENPPAPPNDNGWISVSQTSEQTLPRGNPRLLEKIDLPDSDLWLTPTPPLSINNPALGAQSNGIPQGFLFSEDDVGMPDDENQPEEQNGIPAAVAILSCAVGAYWAPRFRSFRRVAAVLPMNDRNV